MKQKRQVAADLKERGHAIDRLDFAIVYRHMDSRFLGSIRHHDEYISIHLTSSTTMPEVGIATARTVFSTSGIMVVRHAI